MAPAQAIAASPQPRAAMTAGRTLPRSSEPMPLAPSVAIANENRLVVPDVLGTAIKSTRSAAWDARSHGTGGLPPAGQVLRPLYIGPAVMTCLKICRSPARLPASGQGSSNSSRPRAGHLATQCERSMGSAASPGTPNAHSAPAPLTVPALQSARRSPSSVSLAADPIWPGAHIRGRSTRTRSSRRALVHALPNHGL
jgi:hypothetical protein